MGGLIKALPALISLLWELVKLLKDASAKANSPAEFIKDNHKRFKDLRNAKTHTERKQAARDVQHAIRKWL